MFKIQFISYPRVWTSLIFFFFNFFKVSNKKVYLSRNRQKIQEKMSRERHKSFMSVFKLQIKN